MVAFVAIGPGFTPQFIGTGFIIGTSDEGFLLALTAKHVVEEAAVQVQAQKRRRAPSAVSLLFEPEKPRIGPDELRAVWMGADRADMLFVRHISYADNLDVGLCVLETQSDLSGRIRALAPAIALDTEVPRPGSWINIATLSGFEFSGSSPNQDWQGSWKVSTRPLVRVGKVTSQEAAGMGHHGPCFRTSISVSRGMSGGFAYVPRDGMPVAACGIISAGSDADHNQTSFLVAGDSLMAGTLGALGLPMPFPTQDGGRMLFHVLKDGQIIDVAGGATNLRIKMTGDRGACRIFRVATSSSDRQGKV